MSAPARIADIADPHWRRVAYAGVWTILLGRAAWRDLQHLTWRTERLADYCALRRERAGGVR